MKLSYLIVITFIVTFSCTTFAESDSVKTQSDKVSSTSTEPIDTTTNSSNTFDSNSTPSDSSNKATETGVDTSSVEKTDRDTSEVELKTSTETPNDTTSSSDSVASNDNVASSGSVASSDSVASSEKETPTIKGETSLKAVPTSSKTVILNKKDIKKLLSLAMLPKGTEGTFVLEYSEKSGEFTYTLLINNAKKWGITLPSKNEQLEDILTRNKPNPTEKKAKKSTKNKRKSEGDKKEWHKKTNSHLPQKYGVTYHHTPWSKLEPFWRNDTLPRGLLSWFQWKSGGTLILRRDQFYNFRNEGDTIDDDIDLMKTKLVGYNLEMSYRHKIKFFWVGGGITRHSQQASAFDTLFTENENWMRRMGFNVHLAVPGFKYELYRDPRLIPEFGCHDRQVFENLIVQNAFKHEFLYKLEVHESADTLGWKIDTMVIPIDTFYNGKFYPKGSHIYDSTALTRGIWIPRGVGHKLTAKVGLFQYSLYIDPFRYRGPIQSFLLKDLPFFKANWDMGMFILPNGRVIPTGAVDFYTFRIPIRGHGVNITPLRLTFQIASRREFYVGLAFKSEFIPDFSRKKKERQK